MSAALIACPHCDLLHRPIALGDATYARCRRCEAVLERRFDDNLDRPLAFVLAAAILFVVANAFPIVGLDIQGQQTQATLFGTAQALFNQNMQMLAAIVFITTIVVPAVQLSAMGYILILLRGGHRPRFLPFAIRALQAVRPWGMVEVFILGLLVSLVKLAGMASVIPGTGLWSFGGVLVTIAAALASFDARSVWARHEALA